MATPAYFHENTYTHVQDLRPILHERSRNVLYEVDDPSDAFEHEVKQALAEANALLHKGRHRQALYAYRTLQATILALANPEMPTAPNGIVSIQLAGQPVLIDALFDAAAIRLKESLPEFDPSIPPIPEPDPKAVQFGKELLQDVAVGSLEGYPAQSLQALGRAQPAFAIREWGKAASYLVKAEAGLADGAVATRGVIKGQLALIAQEQGDSDRSSALAKQSAELLGSAGLHGEAHAALKLTGGAGGSLGPSEAITLFDSKVGAPLLEQDSSVQLWTRHMKRAVARDMKPEHLILRGEKRSYQIHLQRSQKRVVSDLKRYYNYRTTIHDVAILNAQPRDRHVLVAYLPHIFFFTIPMAIGDCLAAMGQFADAEDEYDAAALYPYLNKNLEAPRLWMRMADLQLAWGDHVYREARGDRSKYGAAAYRYRKIARRTGTIDSNSPLYRAAVLKPMKTRAEAIGAAIAAGDPSGENPEIESRIREAMGRLEQIKANLDYFGLAADYFPPFTFEHLQNLARYFSQQAAQFEQRYIQYTSQAENEEFRREQMEQQADIAAQTVELERRGLDEAEAGVDVAQATKDYAVVQHQNAIAAKNGFNEVRWELLEYAELEAWAGASSVDRSDQVRLTWSGTHYNSSGKNRNLVLQDVAYKRTRVTHDLEAARLDREIASASAYKAVADEQIGQAQARVSISQQRIAIADLQRRQANENVEFLDMKEFNAGMWYEIGRSMKRLMERYIDRGIEVSLMMQAAYRLETGRDLALIKYAYGLASGPHLMGAGLLLQDIDAFTMDYLRTQSKRAPTTQIVSLADSYPDAMASLRDAGVAFFETNLAQFERGRSGEYLRKVRNVELIILGLSDGSMVTGTLRNLGASTYRKKDGTTGTLLYPPDIMPVSDYEVRRDGLLFRVDPNRLRLFENNGVATMWRLNLPRDANDIDFTSILDVRMVIHYDAFYDRDVETSVRNALPATGAAARGWGLAFEAPSEWYYLRAEGQARFVMTSAMLPHNHASPTRTRIKLRATGPAAPGLKVHLHSDATGADIEVTLDANGRTDSQGANHPLGALIGTSLLDTVHITVDAADNPGLAGADGNPDFTGITDVHIVTDYDFAYRA